MVAACILFNPFPPLYTSVSMLYTEHPLKLPHQLMINVRFLLLIANGDGLCTMVIPMVHSGTYYGTILTDAHEHILFIDK